jgi:hypothetical protein
MSENENLLETKEFKLLFNLLEKAEQILSIINLSDSSISKYNTLKKLTFEMLNLEFKPLEKRYIKSNIPSPSSLSNNNNKNTKKESLLNTNDDSLYILHFINIKKSLLIDLMLNYITNTINQEKNLNYYLNSLTEIYNLSSDIITGKNPKDIELEAKNEEAKMAELFTKIDQTFVNNFENMEKINKKPGENINQNNEIKNNDNYFIDMTLNLIDENYERYKQYKKDIDNFNSIAYKDGKIDENILKLEFIKNAFDSFFNNNNQNHNGINIQNKNNELLNDVCDYLPEIIKENDVFHKNFQDLMNYISTNIEGKII